MVAAGLQSRGRIGVEEASSLTGGDVTDWIDIGRPEWAKCGMYAGIAGGLP